MAAGCIYTYNGNEYTEKEFKALVLKGEFDAVLKDKFFKESISSQSNINNEKDNGKGESQSSQEVNAEESSRKESGSENGKGQGHGQDVIPPKGGEPKKSSPDSERNFNDKGILNKLTSAEKTPESARVGFKEKGLKYETSSQKEAEKLAKSVIDEYGIEDAVLLADAQKFDGDVNSLIYAESLNRLSNLELNAKTDAEKTEYARQYAEIGIKYDEAARKGGRFNAAIDYFYKKSPLGIKIMEEAKRREEFKEFSAKKDKSWKEFFDEMMTDPEVKKEFEAKVYEEVKKERASSRTARIKKVDDLIDKAKESFKGGAAYSTIIPPQVITAALEGIKKAYHAGESIAKIVEDAIDYISKELKGQPWDKERFRKDWTDKLGGKEKGSKSVEEIDLDKKTKMLDRFRKKLKGLSENEKDEVIRKSFKKLIENGALEYEDFKKIISETLGYGEMSLAESKKITELVNEVNKVDDVAKKIREGDRTEKALIEYQTAKKTAEKSATELGRIVYNKPDILKRLLSVMQLNTLGIPSLINNPIFNIFNQATVRFPKGLQLTLIDKIIEAGASAFGKDIKAENNILAGQKQFWEKLGTGTKESVYQIATGLTNKDYFQKEVYSSQIHPITSIKELWSWGTGKTRLSKSQLADKTIQSTVGIPAEIIARVLNIGDKPQRYAAEGAQAAVFAKNLGLQGIDFKLFMEFPKEEAYQQYKKQGFSEEVAMKKAEEIQDRIIKKGEESTFQQDNMLNDAITAFFKKFGKGGDVVKTLNMPFLKIPLNAFWSVFNLANPEIALMQSMYYGAKAFKTKSKVDIQKSKEWFAHATTGLALMAVSGSLAKLGVITPSNDDETTKKERQGEMQYEQQNGINLGKLKAVMMGKNPDNVKDGLIVDSKWFGNMGVLMGYQAKRLENMTPEQIKNSQSFMEDMLSNLQISALEFMDKGPFGNTASFVTALNKGGSFMDSYLMNLINMGTNIVHPAALAQISRAKLPYYSNQKADTFLGKLKNNMLTRSDWLRKLSGEYPPSKVGIWGDKLDRGDDTILKLFGMSRQNKDNFAQPIYEYYEKTNNTKFFPSAVKPEIKVGKETIKLNTKQASELEVLVGSQRKLLVAPYVNDMATFEDDGKKFTQEDNDEKIKKLNLLYDRGFKNGKALFLELHPEYKTLKNE